MNVISMSLWGIRALYAEGALSNARLAPLIYPGWTLRVYCSPEVPVIEQLRSLGVDVRIVASSSGHAGLFWRFWPAEETELGHIIVRDADSRLNIREKVAVDAWIDSGRPFHIMRDHPHHRNAPILAGMWGCRGGSIPDIRQRVSRFERGAAKHDDTSFLRSDIWPLIRDESLVHTSVREPLGGEPFPDHPAFEGYVGQIVDPRTEARDLIAILIPSRGRPAAARAVARSAMETATDPERIRVLVGVEPAEADSYGTEFGDGASWLRVLAAGGSYVRAIRELHRSVFAGIYGLCADDFVFETQGWDSKIRKAADALPERLGLVYADDGIQHDRIATAPFVTAEWIEWVGDVLPGDYEHMFCDTELTEIARQAGLLRFLPDVRITHRHHLVGHAVFDATYQRSSATMAAGRAEFERREDERRRLAGSLAEASRTPLLSIMVPTLMQRAQLLDALLANLRTQIAALPDVSRIEVLVEPDAGERAPEAKRKSLLDRATGRWVAFVEDDDIVRNDALAILLRALEKDPDCVTYGETSTVEKAAAGAGGSRHLQAGFALPSMSRRVFAIRRSIALSIARKNAREDFEWTAGIAHRIKRETTIGENVYHHRFGRAAGSPPVAAPPVPSIRRARRPSGFPSPAQELLLTAALGSDRVALSSWARWSSEVGIERADPVSRRFFPLVWWNLARLGATGIELNQLKPYYWDSWAMCHARFELAAEQCEAFRRAGIPTLLLKGVALASRDYQKPELRPMSDVDLMVPSSRAEDALRLMRSNDWRPIQNLPESALPLLHGLGFQDRTGRLLDLHWHALHESRQRGADDGFWARAESIDVGGTTASILSPADQLLHVCVHGLRWAKVPAIHWVADAMAILNSNPGGIEWEVLVSEAQARRVVMQVTEALEYIRGTFEVPALEPVCRRLASVRPSAGDRVDYHLRTSAPSIRRDMLLNWFDHFRLDPAASWFSRLIRFPAYCRDIWGLQSLMEVPATAARKGTNRLKGPARPA